MTKFETAVRENWPDKADTVLGVIRGTISPDTFRSVQDWQRSAFGRLRTHEKIACALNEILDMHGVEVIFRDSGDSWPDLEYLNSGDTYDTTLVYHGGKWRVSSWGDAVERLGL